MQTDELQQYRIQQHSSSFQREARKINQTLPDLITKKPGKKEDNLRITGLLNLLSPIMSVIGGYRRQTKREWNGESDGDRGGKQNC